MCVCINEGMCVFMLVYFLKSWGSKGTLYYDSVREILTLIFHILALKLINVECVILDKNRDTRNNSKIKPRNNMHINHYFFLSAGVKISKKLLVKVHFRISPIWKFLGLESLNLQHFFKIKPLRLEFMLSDRVPFRVNAFTLKMKELIETNEYCRC